MRKSDFLNKNYTFVFKSIAVINYLQVMKNGGNCNAECP